MGAVKLAAIFSGVRSRKDRSYALSFDTRELSGEDAVELLKLHQTEGWLIFSPTEGIDEQNIPTEKANAGLGSKTPSQRLRGVLFVYWQQLGKQGDFEDFYRSKVEMLIDIIKEKLD